MKIGMLASGGLGYDTLVKLEKEFELTCVLTDSKSNSIIDFCEENELPCFKGNPREGKGYNFLKEYEIDILMSANYLFLIEEDIINQQDAQHEREYEILFYILCLLTHIFLLILHMPDPF